MEVLPRFPLPKVLICRVIWLLNLLFALSKRVLIKQLINTKMNLLESFFIKNSMSSLRTNDESFHKETKYNEIINDFERLLFLFYFPFK